MDNDGSPHPLRRAFGEILQPGFSQPHGREITTCASGTDQYHTRRRPCGETTGMYSGGQTVRSKTNTYSKKDHRYPRTPPSRWCHSHLRRNTMERRYQGSCCIRSRSSSVGRGHGCGARSLVQQQVPKNRVQPRLPHPNPSGLANSNVNNKPPRPPTVLGQRAG